MTGRCSCEEGVLERIRPKPEERAYLHRIGAGLIAAVEQSGLARAMMVGSVARDTFIRGDRDLDIFMLFDPALPRQDLEERGLALARSVAAQFGGSCREKYAEHPYINATIDGLDVDLVPCYAVERATEIQSAVDRTPFHTRYIQQHIGSLGDEVLLLKQFAKAGGVYGSDHMTEGFSGYLCELLVIRYGGFLPLLEAAADWKPGTVIDIEGHGTRTFDEPLVVVDPVDPERNVAAALSLTRMSEFVELARGYLDDPVEVFFIPPPDPLVTREDFVRVLGQRNTKLISITFPTPPYTADTVVPQLRKSAESVRELLERSDFVINRIDVCMRDERCMLLFELLADTLPAVRRHLGPPVWSAGNARKFAAKYADAADTLSGPFIEDGRYYVEITRRFTRAVEMLRSRLLLDVALGRHVRKSMKAGWEVREGRECWEEEFSLFFGEFFLNASPLVRIRRYQMECREDQ
ncbi:CCA tRNA nucleotidyltransferase [Methanoculleus frigidifontis]|uniref:CCA tRNA nucleotidyltransferase n=1 Tax=Methanoculleus frigidifontis TaxID=2584085 RepID=UPI00265A170C|nr:CCA tRNA nucleotidyltransferase [Methanoculleus sp. FWC-SCC1]